MFLRVPPDLRLAQILRAKSGQPGGLVPRTVRDVERIVGRAVFAAERRRRAVRAPETAGRFVITCNRAPVRSVACRGTRRRALSGVL